MKSAILELTFTSICGLFPVILKLAFITVPAFPVISICFSLFFISSSVAFDICSAISCILESSKLMFDIPFTSTSFSVPSNIQNPKENFVLEDIPSSVFISAFPSRDFMFDFMRSSPLMIYSSLSFVRKFEFISALPFFICALRFPSMESISDTTTLKSCIFAVMSGKKTVGILLTLCFTEHISGIFIFPEPFFSVGIAMWGEEISILLGFITTFFISPSSNFTFSNFISKFFTSGKSFISMSPIFTPETSSIFLRNAFLLFLCFVIIRPARARRESRTAKTVIAHIKIIDTGNPLFCCSRDSLTLFSSSLSIYQ